MPQAINLKVKYLVLLLLLSITLSYTLYSNPAGNIEPVEKSYKNVISRNIIEIENSDCIPDFFEKLYKLQKGEINKVSILHIGDSHIQPDWLSTVVRNGLQNIFGTRGRGLVFPHQIARTNGASDVYSFSNTDWERFRNLNAQDNYNYGLSGHIIATNDSNAILKIAINNNYSQLNDFNKITVLSQNCNHFFDKSLCISKEADILEKTGAEYKDVYYKVKSGDNLGKIARRYGTTVKNLMRWNGLRNHTIRIGQSLIVKKQKTVSSKKISDTVFKEIIPFPRGEFGSTITFNEPINNFYIKPTPRNELQKLLKIDGFVLENTNSSGIIYNSSGVNGAMYKHFYADMLFFNQLKLLNPDLIIVSLGTNEAFDRDLTSEDFMIDLISFFYSIRDVLGDIDIIFTTPTDNTRRATKTNNIANIIREFAYEHKTAYFDYYSILGGRGSFAKLKRNKMGQRDGVHLTRLGYEMKGQLLFDGIINSYLQYLDKYK
jgi:LysM repeat protein/lysophospholipase L1-like esterase